MTSTTLLETTLRRQGLASAAELCGVLRVSQPTFSRMVASMGPRILRVGSGRAARYALKRRMGSLGDTWPIYSIDAHGKALVTGTLSSLEAGQWAFIPQGNRNTLCSPLAPSAVYPGLPWFLDDLRPQGFLGRSFGRRNGPRLGLSPDPWMWNADAVLTALLHHGDDLPGSFVPGEAMLSIFQQRLLSEPIGIPAEERKAHYPALADAAMAGEAAGSSAGGEQPKFTACVREPDGACRHVIVKFSGKGNRPEDQRWRDLLAAERLAGAVMAEGGLPVARTALLDADGRRFLECPRFDRIDAWGRRGLVSLAALDAAFFGQLETPWTAAAQRLLESGWLSGDDAFRLNIRWWFGNLIGNTDMHYGNVSLFLERERPLSLAPAYDMLPMLYRADLEGLLPAVPFQPIPPPPEALPAWSRALPLAERFWMRVAESEWISPAFQSLARENRAILETYARHFPPHSE